MQNPDPGTAGAADVEDSIARSKHTEGYDGNRIVSVQEGAEVNNKLGESSEIISPQDMQAAPPVNWNTVNNIKIRTTLGGSLSKVKVSADKPSVANGSQQEVEDDRALGQFILLRVSRVIYRCRNTDECLSQQLT